jgi:hypothetical protein
MSIDKDRGTPSNFDRIPESPADARIRVALEQSALYSARLAIARWRNRDADLDSTAGVGSDLSAKARWYAQTQANFQQWMRSGGFSQPEYASCPPMALPAPTLAASKGTAVPDSDARCADACAD